MSRFSHLRQMTKKGFNKAHYIENSVIKTNVKPLANSGISKIERNGKGKQWSKVTRTTFKGWNMSPSNVAYRRLAFALDKDKAKKKGEIPLLYQNY